ncbi:TIGR03435 family protein [Terriglobus sp. RCC_193]|uniref:TIGR03435 family protein n=1 Tax=Terriglobus sp. RCC_193 TaxID=3239218 RepID=UPI00352388AA
MLKLAAAVLFCLLAEGFAIGQTQASPSFDVTVIKPAKPDENGKGWDSDENLTSISNYTLDDLILHAYNLKSLTQLLDAPEWANKEHYDVTAKISPEEYRRLDALPRDENRAEWSSLLRSMLAERFGLIVEESTRRMPRFALECVSAATLGPALKVTPAGPKGDPVGGSNSSRNGGHTKVDFSVSGLTMDDIADRISGSNETGRRVVVNRTGLPGYYNFKMEYAPDNGMGVSADATLPGLIDALRQELGLKLVKDEGEVPVVIVKAAKKPELD